MGSLFSTLIDGSFNYSIIEGKFEKGICSNSLQDNPSNIMIYPVNMPINDEFINIYAVIGESKIEFMSLINL